MGVYAVSKTGGAARIIALAPVISAGPAVGATSVYWGVAVEEIVCEGCPDPPNQVDAIMKARK